jgi:hypothetical protein
MNRRFLAAIAAIGLAAPASAVAQLPYPVTDNAPPIYQAPGYYGTVYGSNSYKSIRTWSAYSSPFGVGYGYGYAPSTTPPGPWGVGIWNPGASTDLNAAYAPGQYRTYQAIPVPEYPNYLPSFGYYAPGFGPPSPPAWPVR